MKVIIATGGTAGHLFPAIKVAECFRQAGVEILWVGAFRQNRKRLQQLGYNIEEIAVKGIIGKNWLGKAGSLIALLKGVCQSFGIIARYRPDVAIGFGGYGSFPLIFASRLKGIPTVIHEQNVVPGFANEILGRWASRIAISFKQSATYFDPNRVEYTGCPTTVLPSDKSKIQLAEEFCLTAGFKTILVFGGSQGSQVINKVFVDALGLLPEKDSCQVIHVTGSEDNAAIKEQYARLKVKASIHPFLENIGDAYQLADLVICRAGALTVFELAMFQKAAILIPYPHAKGHQRLNAQQLCQSSPAIIIEEHDLTKEKLSEEMGRMIKGNRLEGKVFAPGEQLYIPDAAKKIYDLAVSILNEKTR